MEAQAQINQSDRKFSQQMVAVLMIFSADTFLMEAVRPHINLETESIDWTSIFQLPLSAGHKAAAMWAWACWTDEQPIQGNCFDGALNMTANIKVAVLEAMCLRWGLRG